jgi:hypothetical protein
MMMYGNNNNEKPIISPKKSFSGFSKGSAFRQIMTMSS